LAKNREAEIKRAQEILASVDPRVAVMAILQSDVDENEVKAIKDALSKYKSGSIRQAFAELSAESEHGEVVRLSNTLKQFDMDVLQNAAADMFALGDMASLCYEGPSIPGCRQCITRMWDAGIDEIINVARVARYRNAKRATELSGRRGQQ